MIVLIERALFLCFGLFTLHLYASELLAVIAFLTAVILTSLNYYVRSPRFTSASTVTYCALCVAMPAFCVFLPLIIYDIRFAKIPYGLLVPLVPLIVFSVSHPLGQVFPLLFVCGLSAVMQSTSARMQYLSQELIRMRDDSAELQAVLENRNHELMEKQGYEIHVATLKERNRIAREIHDNVGHMLSRSILQIGALMALNRDETIAPHLSELKQSLSQAMDSIRSSVHDLHDESIDLEQSIKAITDHFPTYTIKLDYDISSCPPNHMKYCFLSVLKEAMTNTAKHSDATEISILLREHPALYQMLIQDNGTQPPPDSPYGLGLKNMEERVQALHGNFRTSFDNGFRIFATIPKGKEEHT